LKAHGAEVLVACRTHTPELSALGVETVDGLALDQPDSHPRLLTAIGPRRISLLVHNAGLLAGGRLENETPADIEAQFRINALTPVLLTRALLPALADPAKLAIITSRMGSIADNGSGGYYGYRMSKAAVNAAGVSLAHDLKGRGIAVGLLHPGYVRTRMTGHEGHLTPAESAALLLKRIWALNLDNSGSFWHCDGAVLPW
ncbi:MAG: SDR family NAD(P)-dependent oxidoreductase, partial [Xanthomonadales bacterium]|nr:SDR family NAD(P)-dependent oxidoreductase [Xanthomonadales bacterium]